MAAPAVEAFEGWAPAAPEAVGEAVDGEPLAEGVDALGDPDPAPLEEGDPPELLMGLEADGEPDEVPGLLMVGLGAEVGAFPLVPDGDDKEAGGAAADACCSPPRLGTSCVAGVVCDVTAGFTA